MWSVASILTGLLSFMLSDENNYGSMSSTEAEKRAYAKYSMDFNRKNPTFLKMFPDLANSAEDQVDPNATSQASTLTSPVEEAAPDLGPQLTNQQDVSNSQKSNSVAQPEPSLAWLLAAVVVIVGVLAFSKLA
jgi:ubiquitin-conjugating enzyme E2 J2